MQGVRAKNDMPMWAGVGRYAAVQVFIRQSRGRSPLTMPIIKVVSTSIANELSSPLYRQCHHLLDKE